MRIFPVHNKGFTLIELLVVIVLLSLLYGYTVISTGTASSERALDEEAKRIYALIKLVREESILKSREFIMEVSEKSYLFKVESQGEFVPSSLDVFRKRELADGLELVLHTDNDTHIFYGDEDVSKEIAFLPDGEQTEFELVLKLKDSDKLYNLKGERYGDITFSNSGAKNI